MQKKIYPLSFPWIDWQWLPGKIKQHSNQRNKNRYAAHPIVKSRMWHEKNIQFHLTNKKIKKYLASKLINHKGEISSSVSDCYRIGKNNMTIILLLYIVIIA